ncbi:peptidase M16 inactive domain-containing protein [Cryptosporidium serpentis]
MLLGKILGLGVFNKNISTIRRGFYALNILHVLPVMFNKQILNFGKCEYIRTTGLSALEHNQFLNSSDKIGVSLNISDHFLDIETEDKVKMNLDKGSNNIIYRIEDDNFFKPISEDRKFRFIKLKNNIECFLISDSQSKDSGAALSVGIGSSMEPKSIPGLAHYLEHMLFLGTNKYPDENEYSRYLNDHGGYSNAETNDDQTVYYFSIEATYLEGALERFSEFFKSPRFNKSCLDRELNAVDSEFGALLNSDLWRLDQVQRYLSNSTHVYNKFIIGNKETLDINPKLMGINVRDELIRFYTNYYSSNIMKLAIIGNESLSELEDIVIKYFSDIKDKNIKFTNKYEPNPLNTLIGHLLRIKSINDKNQLSIIFPITYQIPLNEYDPCHYISEMLGSKAEGSLFEYLKLKGWADILSIDCSSYKSGFSYFLIETNLTNEGRDNLIPVINAIFYTIKLLKESELDISFFKQLQIILDANFKYSSQKSSISLIHDIVYYSQYHQCKPEEILKVNYLLKEMKMNYIEEILDLLEPNNMFIILSQPNFDSLKYNQIFNNEVVINNTRYNEEINKEQYEIFLKEKYFGTEYNLQEIPTSFINKLDHINSSVILDEMDIKLPSNNKYIPTDFTLYYPIIKPQRYPTTLFNSLQEFIKYNQIDILNNQDEYKDLSITDKIPDILKSIYYFPVHNIPIPKSLINIRLIFPSINNIKDIISDEIPDEFINNLSSYKIVILTQLLSLSLKLSLSSVLNLANKVGTAVFINSLFSYNYNGTPYGMEILIDGFSHKIPLILYEFAHNLNNSDEFINKYFNHAYDSLVKSLNNQILHSKSYQQCFMFAFEISTKQPITPNKLLKESTNVKYQDIIHLTKIISKYSKLEGIIIGNYTPRYSIAIIKEFLKMIGHISDSNQIADMNFTSDIDLLINKEKQNLDDLSNNISSDINDQIKKNMNTNQITSKSANIHMENQLLNYNHLLDNTNVNNTFISTKISNNKLSNFVNIYEMLDIYSLPEKYKNSYYFSKCADPEDLNSAIMLTLPIPEYTEINKSLLDLVHILFNEKFFSDLRTKQQLGYIVNSSPGEFGNIILYYLFIIQSSQYDVKYITERILDFYENKFIIDNIDKESFELARKSIISQLKIPPRSLGEIKSIYLSEIVMKRFNFNWKEIRINYLENLKYEEFIEWFNETFPNSPKLITAVQSQNINKEKLSIDEIEEYIPNGFIKLNDTQELFKLENIKIFKFTE